LDIKNSLGSDQPTYKGNASGALTSGETVVLNSDGTISGIDSTNFTSGATLGTNRLQGEGDKEPNPIVYDPANDRFIAVRDDGNYIRIKIGTISSTTVTWGSWTTVYTSTIQIRNKYSTALWDADSGQIVIFFYTNQSGYYKANLIVRAISSNGTITGSSHNVFNFGGQYPSISRVPCIFKSAVETSLIHVAWQKHGSGSTYYLGFVSYGIGSDSITREDETNIATDNDSFWAGTQPDGTIVIAKENAYNVDIYTCQYNTSTNSLGTRTASTITLNSSETNAGFNCQIVYDPSRSGWWIASRYYDGSYTNYARNVHVGFFTITGSGSASLTAKKYASAIAGPDMWLVYHPPSRSAILAHGGNHPHEQNLQMGYITMYFDSSNALQTTKTYPLLRSGTHTIGARSIDRAMYIPNKKQVVAFHIDAYWEGLTHYDRDFNFFQPTYTDTNLTATNFLGFADGAYANGVEAKAIVYPGVASGQSGLTTGTKYYVQMDGTLATTADDISQVAGVAQSASTIKVQYS
jgi:hypothetical protein